jgi:hypothetical protein
MRKVLATLFLTALLGATVSATTASAQTKPIHCDLRYGCWHN